MAEHTKRLTISFTLNDSEIDELNAAIEAHGDELGGHDEKGQYMNRSYFAREYLREYLAKYSNGDNNE